jgi:hypothetical protein
LSPPCANRIRNRVPARVGGTSTKAATVKELVNELVKFAQANEQVASKTLEGGLRVFAYPYELGVVVGLGYGADQAYRVRASVMLRTRASDIERFGAWLPARFADGGVYVLRHLRQRPAPGSALSEHELSVALELF